MTTYWFKPKRYGYGATPVTWQGWAVVGVAVAAIVADALLVRPHRAANPWTWVAFFAIEAAILVALWIVSRRKTEGGFRWRWGDRA
jgi:hypothetical protein